MVEVAWALQANHAGGYSYRLCPRKTNTTTSTAHGSGENPVTEDCFQRHPLRFVGQQSLRWGGKNNKGSGQQIFFNGTYVSEGTSPIGSMWSRNPIPRTRIGNGTLAAFPPYCPDQPDCTKAPVFLSPTQSHAHAHSQSQSHASKAGSESHQVETRVQEQQSYCRCSEGGETGLGDLEIVDQVQIPADLEPGEWVLGWRWDCEESNQIWSSCSDITIEK